MKMIGKSGQNQLFHSRLSILGQAPRGIQIDQFTPEALNSFEASNALVVGTIAEEVKYVNESLKQMNYSILVMARNMDDTMGRMGDFMP